MGVSIIEAYYYYKAVHSLAIELTMVRTVFVRPSIICTYMMHAYMCVCVFTTYVVYH
jgi:hypothetical protein